MPLLACLVLVAACTETPEKAQARMQAEAAAARPEIEAVMARFSRGAALGNADTALSIYAPDAVVMAPMFPAMDLQTAREQFTAAGAYRVSFAIRSLEVNGPVAIERGVWSAEMAPLGFTYSIVRDGKYLAHWRKIGGQWLIVEHIWNDDFPPLM
jgi:ketosteroid isomerase-like protein